MAQRTGSQIGDSGACSTWTWHPATHPNTHLRDNTLPDALLQSVKVKSNTQTHKQHTRQREVTLQQTRQAPAAEVHSAPRSDAPAGAGTLAHRLEQKK